MLKVNSTPVVWRSMAASIWKGVIAFVMIYSVKGHVGNVQHHSNTLKQYILYESLCVCMSLVVRPPLSIRSLVVGISGWHWRLCNLLTSSGIIAHQPLQNFQLKKKKIQPTGWDISKHPTLPIEQFIWNMGEVESSSFLSVNPSSTCPFLRRAPQWHHNWKLRRFRAIINLRPLTPAEARPAYQLM